MKEGFLAPYLEELVPWLYADSYYWTAFGSMGALLFGSRFVVQWLVSEKEKRVTVPDVFWYLSFAGSVINLIYALHLDRFPLLLGTFFLPLLYGRNIYLLLREKNKRTSNRKLNEFGFALFQWL